MYLCQTIRSRFFFYQSFGVFDFGLKICFLDPGFILLIGFAWAEWGELFMQFLAIFDMSVFLGTPVTPWYPL